MFKTVTMEEIFLGKGKKNVQASKKFGFKKLQPVGEFKRVFRWRLPYLQMQMVSETALQSWTGVSLASQEVHGLQLFARTSKKSPSGQVVQWVSESGPHSRSADVPTGHCRHRWHEPSAESWYVPLKPQKRAIL